MMEVMQCGLNWNMMTQKREILCQYLDGFDYEKVALYAEADVERILASKGMIRSRRKIGAVICNARCFRVVREGFNSFSRYLWGLSKRKTLLYSGHQKGKIPIKNSLPGEVSRGLKHQDFKYLGSITVYSHLQACRIINGHKKECFRYRKIVE